MKTLKYYFSKAQKEGFAIGQFNFSDFTQMKGVVNKAVELKSPIILGTSEGESNFFGLDEAVALRNVLRKKTGLPIFLNLDHGKTFESVKKAVDAGYDMVHFDGSKLPFEENVKITKQVIKYARRPGGHPGTLVEGEMGMIGNESSKLYSEKFEIKEENLTNPVEAGEYIKKTGVDLLAISIGNFHGIEISGIDPNLRLDLLQKIRDIAGKTMLVLHGGSGTPEDDIKGAIKIGIEKINVNTDLRMTFTGSIRRYLDENPEEIVPYKFLSGAKDSVERAVGFKIGMFGSANKV